MKNSIAILLAGAMSSQAALVHFDLSPPGTDVANGLSPLNEVPAVTNSTGSGDEISGGIVFDTDAYLLTFAIGYGSAAGFANLTGVPTALDIRGPASAGHNGPSLIDLAPYNFTAPSPANGGVIFGTVHFPTNQAANLLAGSYYVNIHTAANTNGELRGQISPVSSTNTAPSLSCTPALTVECPNPVVLTVLVSDPEGDALTLVWTVNGLPLQTNTVPASDPRVAQNVSFTVSLPLGTNIVAVAATDTGSNTASCATVVTVVDTIPPVVTAVSATPNTLWPPNHKLVSVQLQAQVTDACGPTTWKIVGVTSNERVKGKGDGNTTPDWVITGDHTVKLRAERSGRGDGRVYTISVQATDAAGNKSLLKTTTVSVAHSQGKGNDHQGGNQSGNSNQDNKGNNGKGNGDGNGKGNGNGHKGND